MKYIGLDVGTSGCKAAVVDGTGAVYAASHREYSFESPSGGCVELNPDRVWNAVCEVLGEIGPLSGDAAALSVSSIGESLIFLDRNDKPLANGIVYLDTRSEETLSLIKSAINPRELYGITGMPLHQMYSLSRFLWQRKYTPLVIDKAEKIFMFGDFINYKLTGKRAIDPGSASRTMMFDSKKRLWSDYIMDTFNIPKNKFSPVMNTGAIIGTILPFLAEKTGLNKNLKIVLGCHDQCSATLGSGVFGKGQLMLGEGASESMNAIVEYADINEDSLFKKEICIEPYITPDEYIIALGMLQHGTSIKWFVNNHRAYYESKPSMAGESLYARADRFCAENSGELYFIPYLTRSNVMDASSRALGCFIGLEYSSDIAAMYRAVLEGLAFESKYNLMTLEETGFRPLRFVATGGGSKSALYMQIKSDVLECTIDIPMHSDSGIMGLAMIGAVAMGEFETYTLAAENIIKIRKRFIPRPNYRKRLDNYIRINKNIKELYHSLQGSYEGLPR
jgi:xylulokinase